MLTLTKLYSLLDEYAPFEISREIIKAGGYDNSGIIIKEHENINKILFALDLSVDAVKRAKRLGCDTIITHHPAIYNPINSLDYQDANTGAILLATKYGMNVISMHLNLDFAPLGIDYYLADALGGKGAKILEQSGEKVGYGREFCLNKTTLKEFVSKVNTSVNSNKNLSYGSANFVFNKVASFCGGGSSHALKALQNGLTDANVIVTSDIPHHVIKEFIDRGVALVIPTHYAAENYGFNKFYEWVSATLGGEIQAYYFDDKRYL